MNKKILSVILASSLIFNSAPAKADSDDAAWAVGGLILGMIIADSSNDDRNSHRNPPPPPPQNYPPHDDRPYHREPRLIPVYQTVCEYREQYDAWGRPYYGIKPLRVCHQEIVGYRTVY